MPTFSSDVAYFLQVVAGIVVLGIIYFSYKQKRVAGADERARSLEQAGALSQIERQERLNQAMCVKADEVALNRRGQLSKEQTRIFRIREQMAVFVGIGTGAYAIWRIYDTLRNGPMNADMIGSETVAALVFPIILLFAMSYIFWMGYVRSPLRGGGGVVRHAEGVAKLVRTSAPTVKTGINQYYFIELDGVRARIRPDAAMILGDGKPYRMHYLDASGDVAVLSIEELA